MVMNNLSNVGKSQVFKIYSLWAISENCHIFSKLLSSTGDHVRIIMIFAARGPHLPWRKCTDIRCIGESFIEPNSYIKWKQNQM